MIVILILVGLCFGSFVNALVWRLHEQEDIRTKLSDLKSKKTTPKSKISSLNAKLKSLSIAKGRSMCVHCQHVLSAKDLIPVLSWVELRGKCRYCQKKIEDTPLAELLTPALLVASYIWWPYAFNAMGITNFIIWCVMIVAFVALIIYDIRWLTLPNKIVYPLVILAAVGAALNATIFHGGLAGVRDVALAILIDAGIFYALFQVSRGKWIGGGDVKLGLLIGFLIAEPMPAFLVLFLASVIGTVIILPGLITKRLSSKSHIPFGPFLIIATIVVKLFGASFIAWYRAKFLIY